jgi:DNA invertase Pin-like site-specific DNA recombinase
MTEFKCVLYFRVSTSKQGISGLGLDAQRSAVQQFLSARPAKVISEFVEVESGGKDDRPRLREALACCRSHKSTLIIAKLDRLARSVKFVSDLMDGDVDFLAVDMPTASRFVLHIMAAVAEHERHVISARTKAALASAKARGTILGKNGKVLAAVRKADAIEFSAGIKNAVKIARIEGAKTMREVASSLNMQGVPARQGGQWHACSVSRLLKRLPADL